jgi:NAD(P)-dependent dehydrogenase (short-subunit alcohol dehydrogenase family)
MERQGKTVIVSGGASGLGRATALRLHAAGMNVGVLDRNQAEGAKLVAELGERAHFAAADVTSADAVKAAIDGLAERFGGLHAAVSCAGVGAAVRTISKHGPMDLGLFATVVQINLIGTFNVARLAAEKMAQNRPDADGERGVIVNTASVAAFDGQTGQTAYAASKGGIVAMTLPMARDLARHGIRVMTIAPGLFDTPLLAMLPQEQRDKMAQAVPFPPRLGRATEFAALVEHIVDNHMLNGEVIRLDGALRLGQLG